MSGDAFTVGSLIDVRVTKAKEVLAPSYRFNRDANETAMRADAMISYGVKPRD
ncbi:MAG: hypothetical protein KTR23_08750 [Rhodospirillales bacterium]|nr:hypothetical protein [Rhodospirillales bacterium]